jgi:ATP-dependent RNA helicase SUPV3L1/SUV3
MDEFWELNDEEIIAKLETIKQEYVEIKNLEIANFLEHINEQKHPYLNEEEISTTLKRMPPDVALFHAPVKLNIIESILTNISDKYDVFESTDHIIIEKEKSYDLFGTLLYYSTSVSYEKPFFYNLIWRGEEPPVKEDINRVNDALLSHFKVAVDELLEEMKEMSQKLNIEESKLHEFIVRFVAPQIESSTTLKFKEKSKRRILFHFGEYIKPLLAKQKR